MMSPGIARAVLRDRVVIVLKGYPRLSETFIAQEILGLKRLGLKLSLVSLRNPTDERAHPVHQEIAEVPNYLPEYLHDDPLRVLKSWWLARRLAGYRAARKIFLADLKRDRTRNRIRRFGQALVLAAEMPADVGFVYGHFLHTPGSVARYGSVMRGLRFGISAHAKDIWTIPDWETAEKLADCAFLVTCTRSNAEHLEHLSADPARVSLVYHGLDFTRFGRKGGDEGPSGETPRDGGDPAAPLRLLTVGRLVDKKGYRGLFDALTRLPPDLEWRLGIVGSGPLKCELESLAKSHDIAKRIAFLGSLEQGALLPLYRSADLFVLNCRISEDGDRDGLPNVLMEAQSQGLACISTDVSAVSELIVDGATGILVGPDDPGALADAIELLARDPPHRRRLSEAGLERVTRHFGHTRGIEAVHRHIRAALAAPPR